MPVFVLTPLINTLIGAGAAIRGVVTATRSVAAIRSIQAANRSAAITAATGAGIYASQSISPNDDKNANGGNADSKNSPTSSSTNNTQKVSSNNTVMTSGQVAVAAMNPNHQMDPLPNPLGAYSSYTYQITLYMSTPDAINRFVERGEFDVNDQHYIVAQSGGIGINEKRGVTNTGELGPNQLGLDYYIDDLELKIVLTGGDGSPTVGTDIKFKIIEPIGFNFFTQLSAISDKLNQISEIIKQSPNIKPPPLRQNYLIGIRFYGYDAAGNIVTATETPNFYKSGINEVKSKVSDYANFERFFTFQISNISYQIDGRVVTYHVEGAPMAKQIGQGSKFGLTLGASTIVAGTVDEALQGNSGKSSETSRSLMQILAEQEEAKIQPPDKKAEKANKFEIVWGENTEPLRNGKLVDDPIFKNMTPGSGAKNTKEATPKTAEAAQSINTNKKQITIPQGTPVLFAMDQIMAKSTYVTEKLTAQNDQAIEAKTTPNSTTAEIQWYSINPVVKILGRDDITKDWTYDIKYYIDIQRIEYIRALYVKRTSRWFGPHKRYSFFLTGENSEIISFEQKYDTQFYLLQAMSTNSTIRIEKNENINTPSHLQGGTTNKPIGGDANRGSEMAANTALRMNSIADQATANIKILGDPHYLMSNIGGIKTAASLAFSEVYNVNAETMNPYRNQIWIQIMFKGADDYTENGTLRIKDVDFYGVIDPVTNKQKIEGLIYRVIEVTNTFSGGKFTQDLDLILVGANDLNNSETKTTDTGRASDYEAGAGRGGRGGPTAQEMIDWRMRQMSRGNRNDPLRIDGPPIISSPEEQLTPISSDDDAAPNTKPKSMPIGGTTYTVLSPEETQRLPASQPSPPPRK